MRTVWLSALLLGVLTLGCDPPYLAKNPAESIISATVTPSRTIGPSPTASGTPVPTNTPTSTPPPGIIADLQIRTNNLRASLGLPPFTLNTALGAAAQNHAEWMVSTGLVTHVRPDGSTPGQRAAAAGYPNSAWVTEIIYMGGIATPNHAWEFWTNSPVHYRELTRAEHREIGIGTATNKTSGQAFVIVFGRPGGVVGRPGGQTPIPITPGSGTYIVQPGDTLFRIAQRHGVTLEALAAANRIGVNDTIYVGQVLVIPQQGVTLTASPTALLATPTVQPATPTPSPTRTAIIHIVQPGETLFLIARKYGVPLDKLIAVNGITNPDRIEVGQVIIIP